MTFFQFCEGNHFILSYGKWGWISPDGVVHDGLEQNGVHNHQKYLNLIKHKEDLKINVKDGWVRWYEHGTDICYEINTLSQTISPVIAKAISNHVKSKLYTHYSLDVSDASNNIEGYLKNDERSFLLLLKKLSTA